ncbi:MAG: hypothetical protein HZB65_04770 [Candidatus Aenigmarchaeota archaeon]|nr:hypothetical protein [Candidatus Aenigmarchaeota archaeon]
MSEKLINTQQASCGNTYPALQDSQNTQKLVMIFMVQVTSILLAVIITVILLVVALTIMSGIVPQFDAGLKNITNAVFGAKG